MDIWGILGIDASAGVDAIRAAYSEKVKLCHPEEDPEGFMRIREAYKAAIRMATASGRPTGAKPLASERPASKITQKAERPLSSAFDFSEVEDASAARDETVPQPAFDFSGLGETEPELEQDASEAAEPAFDFSAIEQAAAKHDEKEEQFIAQFIAQAMALYSSRKRKKVEYWRALLTQPELEALKRSEAFTWAFLDFVALATELPSKVRTLVISPFSKELRSFWQGTELWGEFDVAEQKYTSKRLQKADRIFHIQLILLFVIPGILVTGGLDRTSLIDMSDARGLLSNLYASSLSSAIYLALATVSVMISQMACFSIISKTLNSGVPEKRRIGKSRFVYASKTVNIGVASIRRIGKSALVLLIALVLAVVLGIVTAYAVSEVREYGADRQQIDEWHLSEDIVYVYQNIRIGEDADTVLVTAADKSNSSLREYMTMPKGLNFNPPPSCLLDDNLSVQANQANGMKAYRVLYTDNHKVIVSITEAP